MLTVVAKAPVAARPGVILFVDDEPRVLTSMRAMFRRGYQVLTANSAAEGLELIRSRAVDVVVSDQRMPGMTGVEMLTEIRSCSPHTMRILLTGYADLEAIEASINDCEVFRYLMKPCPPDQLREAVAQALIAAQAADLSDPTVTDVVDEVVIPASAEVVVLHQQKPPRTQPSTVEATLSPRMAQPSNDSHWPEAESDAGASARVDVLILSLDSSLNETIRDAVQAQGDNTLVHGAANLNQALNLLAAQPIGVLITDMAISEHDVTVLTSALKQQVPALITILVADRSDASVLIDLINHGQVFRFLLKPIPLGQCRLWLTSARKRHLELARSEAERLRYQPLPMPGTEPLGVDDGDLDGTTVPAEPVTIDHSAAGIRLRISRQLTSLKQRFNRWSLRHG